MTFRMSPLRLPSSSASSSGDDHLGPHLDQQVLGGQLVDRLVVAVGREVDLGEVALWSGRSVTSRDANRSAEALDLLVHVVVGDLGLAASFAASPA